MMSQRIFAIASLASAVLWGCVILLWASSFILNPRDQRLSVTDTFHVGLLKGRIVFFNDKDYGPYQGSIIAIGDEHLPRSVAWGDRYGVYYRYFAWSDSTLWTLSVSLLYPVVLLAILPVIRLWKRSRIRKATRTS